MEATLLVESTRIRVVPQHPQRHFGKSTVHEFLEHMIHQHATAALAALEDDLRETVTAHLWGGLTFDQIAALTGTSASTAHRRYQQGLERL